MFFCPISNAKEPDCNSDMDSFLSCNQPMVIEYISQLSDKNKGQVLNGIKLTDGDMFLKECKFLGQAKSSKKGVKIYLFESRKRKFAVLWVDKDGEPFELPKCGENDPDPEPLSLTGDVITWSTIEPDSLVVKTGCINDTWMKNIK